MGTLLLLRLNKLPVECITSWASLSRLFTMNYQASYHRPGNTHHLARVQIKKDESLQEYTNRFFKNLKQLASVKDEDVIIGYFSGT
jgi:hypothetical protein